MRAELIEIAIEQDDDAMEKFLEGEEPDIETLQGLIRKGDNLLIRSVYLTLNS